MPIPPIYAMDHDTADEIISDIKIKGLAHQIACAIAYERERAAQAAEWFSNVENFTAADVAKRIRDRQ